MMEHTPGPWMEYEGQPGWVAVFPKPSPGRGSVALALVRDGNPESPANARLIAAAPDLLAALTALFESYKELADSGDAGFWSLEEQDVGKQALAAIARATSAITRQREVEGDHA